MCSRELRGPLAGEAMPGAAPGFGHGVSLDPRRGLLLFLAEVGGESTKNVCIYIYTQNAYISTYIYIYTWG